MKMIGGFGPPSLVRTLTLRLVLTTLIAMLLQATLVTWREYLNETDFLNSYVRREANKLARLIGNAPDSLDRSDNSNRPGQYIGANASSYAFRIVDENGNVQNAHNVVLLDTISAWTDKPSLRQDFWVRKFKSTERMFVAGGLKVRRGDSDIWIELATSGDPDNTYLSVIAADVLDDIAMPILPISILGLLVTVVSVRRSFQPLMSAAKRADAISVRDLGERIDISQLPSEASQFASAINRLIDRVSHMVGAQRLFIARAAHELRTPLSIMMLELGHLKDPASKGLETDVRAMSKIVDQLLLLARLEAAPKTGMAPVDVATVVRELVSRMLVWAEKDGHKLSFVANGDRPVIGDETSIREAARNLIENAVKHTPAGTEIRVEVTSDASIVVEDSGPGLGSLTAEELQLPFRKGSTTTDGAGLGLAIVRQAAELHGAKLDIGSSRLGGARFTLQFPRLRRPLVAAA